LAAQPHQVIHQPQFPDLLSSPWRVNIGELRDRNAKELREVPQRQFLALPKSRNGLLPFIDFCTSLFCRSVYSRVTINNVPEFLNPAAEGGI
jgi:hypothetical protein